MHMHGLKCQYHKNMFGIISTPKVPASFPFQVQRSHTLSNWDAIQDAPCTWTKRICSLRSSAKTRKKSRQGKKQIQKIALVAMSTWTGMTYHPCRTRSKACSMKCLKSSDVVGPPSGYFILNPSWRYSEEFSMLVLESNIVCCIVPCQLLVETYGLDVNHKDSIGQTCSSTAILMPRLWIREQIDARKTPFTIRWCTKMQTVRVEVCVCVCACVRVCVCVSCSFLQKLALDDFGDIPASYQHLGKGVGSWYWCDFSVTGSCDSCDLNDCSKRVLYSLQVWVV